MGTWRQVRGQDRDHLTQLGKLRTASPQPHQRNATHIFAITDSYIYSISLACHEGRVYPNEISYCNIFQQAEMPRFGQEPLFFICSQVLCDRQASR